MERPSVSKWDFGLASGDKSSYRNQFPRVRQSPVKYAVRKKWPIK